MDAQQKWDELKRELSAATVSLEALLKKYPDAAKAEFTRGCVHGYKNALEYMRQSEEREKDNDT